jgi:hypothetical protein
LQFTIIGNWFNSHPKNVLHPTRVWQKWRFSAPQTHLWLIKHLFSASTFVVKIATFAKPQNVLLGDTRHKRNILRFKFSIYFRKLVR